MTSAQILEYSWQRIMILASYQPIMCQSRT